MSVGHVARMLEESGIPTVIIAVRAFRPRIEMMTLPRVLLTPFMMGFPIGYPGKADSQRQIITAALNLLTDAQAAGTIREMN